MNLFPVAPVWPTTTSGRSWLTPPRAIAGSAAATRSRNRIGLKLFCGLLVAEAVFGLLASGAAGAVLIPGDQAGTFADGGITSRFLICTTCSPASDVLDDQHKGGFFDFGPAIVSGFGVGGTGRATFDARAIIFGPTFLPQLSADAGSTPGVGPHSGFSGDGAYFFTATASAKGVQYFTYIGRTPAIYTIGFVFRGEAVGAHAEDDPFVSISGGIGLFDDGDKLGGERPLGDEVDGAQETFHGGAGGFFDTGSVSITLNPGQSFYVSTFLIATVTGEADGFADASHTFATSFTAGDTSLLRAELPDSPTAAVPEPATWVLTILGFGALAGFAGRRRASALRKLSPAPWR